MKAIIETGGKQYLVEEGTVLYVEKLDVEAGKKVEFKNVLMAGEEVGHPYVKGAVVKGEVLKHGKNKKVIVYHYTSKNRSSRKKQGHRQPYTKVEIKSIEVK